MADDKQGANPTTTTLEEAREHGYLGTVADELPNSAYTVAGVTGSEGEHVTSDPDDTGATPAVPGSPGAPDAGAGKSHKSSKG